MVLLFTKRPHKRKIMNLFWKLKLELHIFQQYFTPLKQGESKTMMGPKHTHHTRTFNNSHQ